MKTWAILVTKQDDGQWTIHVPEIHHRRQIERHKEIRAQARAFLGETVGVDERDIVIRFHNLTLKLDELELVHQPDDEGS